MSDDIYSRLTVGVRRHNGVPVTHPVEVSSELLIEAAGKIVQLRVDNERLRAEVKRLRAALEEIAEERDAGRHDGRPEPGPAYDDVHVPWLIARETLEGGR